MDAILARLYRFFLLGLVLTMGVTSRSAVAQEQVGWDRPGREAYVSKGINVNRHWGTFVLYPGGRGRALYLLGNPAVIKSVNLEYIAAFPSTTNPVVHYSVYKELSSARLWAFQIDGPTLNGYVIYVKDSGEPWAPGWELYDFAD